MNHARIADQDIIGQYRRGSLSAEDAESFEVHLLVCPDCRAMLESDARLERGLRTIDADSIAEPNLASAMRPKLSHVAIAATTAMLVIAAALQWRVTRAPVFQVGQLEFQLPVTRGTNEGVTEFRIPAEAESYVIAIESPVLKDCCRVRIEDAVGDVVWKGSAPIEAERGVVRILLGRALLHTGTYRISLVSTALGEARFIEHKVELKFEG